MPLTQTSLYSLIFLILCIAPHHINAMENIEKSIQENLDSLDKKILQNTLDARRQKEEVAQKRHRYTQYLMKEQQTKKRISLWDWCSDVNTDVMSSEERDYQRALDLYNAILSTKKSLEKQSMLLRANFELSKRLLELPEDNNPHRMNRHKKEHAVYYQQNLAESLNRYY